MSAAAVDELLQRLELLPASDREKQAAQYARAQKSPQQLQGVIDTLSQRGAYELRLAGIMACATTNAAWITAHVAHPDPSISSTALRTAAQHPDRFPDSLFVSALQDAPEARRQTIAHAVVRRPAVADRIVHTLRAEWGDAAAALVLPSCSPKVVAELLPAVLHAVHGWKALARRCPAALFSALAQSLEESSAAATEWWERYAGVLAILIRVHARYAGPVLDLLDKHSPSANLPSSGFPEPLQGCMGKFAKQCPDRLLRVLVGPLRTTIGQLPKPAIRSLARSGAPLLEAYVRQIAKNDHRLAELLGQQAPSARRATYEAATSTRIDIVPSCLLDVLPSAYSTELARKNLERVKTKKLGWQAEMAQQAYLPPDEVFDTLLAATRRSLAEEREAAWGWLVDNAAHSRSPAALMRVTQAMADRLRNEQMPVRSAALVAARRVPRSLWTMEAIQPLTIVFQNTVNASDFDTSQWALICDISMGIYRAHAASKGHRDWALDVQVMLNEETRASWYTGLLLIPRGLEKEWYASLAPFIRKDRTTANFEIVFALANALGRRAYAMEALQEDLEYAIVHGSLPDARMAIELWLRSPKDRAARVEHVLQMDRSALAIPAVSSIVAAKRTDLLDDAVASAPYGRFLVSDATWLFPPPPARMLRRWTAKQCRSFIVHLDAVVRDGEKSMWDRQDALRSAANVPGGIEFARKWSLAAEVSVAETALRMLSSSPDDMGTLLGRAADDTARVALYAARRCSALIRPSVLEVALPEVLRNKQNKVTSRKEVARLIAERLPQTTASSILASVVADQNTHPDVRAGCISVASKYLLSRKEGWAMMSAASASTDAASRRAVLGVAPLDLLRSSRPKYASAIASVIDSEDDDVAAQALSAAAMWITWATDSSLLERVAGAITDMDASFSRWYAAAGTLVQCAPTPDGERVLCAALSSLVSYGMEPDAGDTFDRPAYRRVQHLRRELGNRACTNAMMRAPAVAVASLLSQHDAYIPEAAMLLAQATDSSNPDAMLENLLRVAELCADRPLLAFKVSQGLRSTLAMQSIGIAEPFLDVARAVMAQDGAAGAFLACGMVETFGRAARWAPEWRDVLRDLRKHPSPDVRMAAAELSTA